MSEKRPLYHAHSGTTEEHTTPRGLSPLVQCSVDGSVSRDTILLLPIMRSAQNYKPFCLHLIHLPDGKLHFCNAEAWQRCIGCDAPMCEEHQSPYSITLPDVYGVWTQEHRAPLCQTCAQFPLTTVFALHEFRRLLNREARVEL